MKHKRRIEQLEARASLWWPRGLSSQQADSGVIPLLIKTQETFVSLLKISGGSPFAIFDILNSTDLPGNLFLKHLAVLADLGGEPLQRINDQFDTLFEKTLLGDKYFFEFMWHSSKHRYDFSTLPAGSLNNARMGIDGDSLNTETPLSPLHRDVAAILLFGSTHCNKEVAETTLSKCEVGSLLGRSEEIERYVKQRYIWVSRITGGAQSNTLGQLAQTHVLNQVVEGLGSGYKITRNGKIQVKRETIPFDIVVEKDGKFVGIEVSFQVTTNSVIERKANEAENRKKLMRRAGHHIAYVIDGAGNFQRKSAVSKICANSDCTVAYTSEEFNLLIHFIKEVLG